MTMGTKRGKHIALSVVILVLAITAAVLLLPANDATEKKQDANSVQEVLAHQNTIRRESPSMGGLAGSHAMEDQKTEVVNTIEEYLSAIEEGNAQVLARVYTSMKDMTPEALAQKARDDALKFKGLTPGLRYDKPRTRIIEDMAVSFPDSDSAGPLFLVREDDTWKMIVDWSLPHPVGTTYSAERIEIMKTLHQWGRELREKPTKPSMATE